MNLLDTIVFVVVGFAALGGIMRGLVQEILSLASWILALAAIYFLHTRFYEFLRESFGEGTAVSVLAFGLLFLIPYTAMKVLAGYLGEATRNSILGPIDRIAGFIFGAAKGGLIAVMIFSLIVLGYDTAWGVSGRPAWMISARSYPLLNESSASLVEMIEERRLKLRNTDLQD